MSVDVKKRLITFKNEIMPMTAVQLLIWLEFFESIALGESIVILFDSCSGGDWVAAKYMYAALRQTRSKVIGIAKNFVNSAAIAVLAGTRERIAFTGTTLAFHTIEITKRVDVSSKITLPTSIGKDRMTASVHAQLNKEASTANEEFYRILTEGFEFPHTYIARMLCEEERTIRVTHKSYMEQQCFNIFHFVVSSDGIAPLKEIK